MDGDSVRTVATRSPEVECTVWTVEGETLADGVSTCALGVMDGGWLRTVMSRSPDVKGAAMEWGVRLVLQCDGRSCDGFTQERACQHWDVAVT